jgi:hypothetical protein
MDQPFFDLPIYRLPEEDYFRQRERYAEELIDHAGGRDERQPDIVRQIELNANRKYGGQWIYNEIIGFIRLYFDGSQVLGHYFRTNAKRITRTRRKTFEWITHKLASEVDLPYDAGRPFNPTSEEILSAVTKYINRCKKELPKQYIDDSEFMRLAAFIDWKALWTALGSRRPNDLLAPDIEQRAI